jgi:hypothetical protein
MPEPTNSRELRKDQGWLTHLRDQAEAERACVALLIELDDWERARKRDGTAG